MTLFCQKIDHLPPAEMKLLCRGAQASHYWERDPQTGLDVERYTYAWRDFQIDLYITAQPDIVADLEGFLRHASNLARGKRQVLSSDFKQRVRSTQLLIGYIAGPDYDEPSRFHRLENLVLGLCESTQSILFWQDKIYDEYGALLIG